MKKVIFIAIVAALAASVFTGCAIQREGCPAAHSNGIMRGKFKG